MIEWLKAPWPWYVAGTIIGLTVPVLLLVGNKAFGISSSFRHICAACIPARIPFFRYDWKREAWNLWFVAGAMIGGFLASRFLADPDPMVVAASTREALQSAGVASFESLMPSDLFSWDQLFTLRGMILMAGGGFLIGFGTRYAGGCTSGHSIMGLSTLQWPSLVATVCFMAGGAIMTWLILPHILRL